MNIVRVLRVKVQMCKRISTNAAIDCCEAVLVAHDRVREWA